MSISSSPLEHYTTIDNSKVSSAEEYHESQNQVNPQHHTRRFQRRRSTLGRIVADNCITPSPSPISGIVTPRTSSPLSRTSQRYDFGEPDKKQAEKDLPVEFGQETGPNSPRKVYYRDFSELSTNSHPDEAAGLGTSEELHPQELGKSLAVTDFGRPEQKPEQLQSDIVSPLQRSTEMDPHRRLKRPGRRSSVDSVLMSRAAFMASVNISAPTNKKEIDPASLSDSHVLPDQDSNTILTQHKTLLYSKNPSQERRIFADSQISENSNSNELSQRSQAWAQHSICADHSGIDSSAFV